MKSNSSLTLLILVAFVLVVSMSACGAGRENWQEEVKLSDGRTIVVEREKLNEPGGDEWVSNRKGTKPKEYRIRFADPAGSGKVIEWRSTKQSPRNWPEIPLFLDMESGGATIYSLVAISIGCEVYSKYLYRNGVWVEEALPEKFEKRAANLFFGNRANLPAFIDLAEKQKRNSDDRFRSALRFVGPVRRICG